MRTLFLWAAISALLAPALALAQDDNEGGDVGAIDREAGPLRDLVYSETLVGNTSSFRNQLVVEAGVSLFFPPTFTEP